MNRRMQLFVCGIKYYQKTSPLWALMAEIKKQIGLPVHNSFLLVAGLLDTVWPNFDSEVHVPRVCAFQTEVERGGDPLDREED